MDPVTHGIVGALAAKSVVHQKENKENSKNNGDAGKVTTPYIRIWLLGLLGGMVPDLDVVIRSEANPLLAIEYHRHFTHAVFFIPVAGLLASLPWFFWPSIKEKYRSQRKTIFLAASMGAATHGFMDFITSYGTLLFWPLSNTRFALDSTPVIDPLFSLPLLIALIISVQRNSRRIAIAALIYGLIYIGNGYTKNQTLASTQQELANLRGHTIERSRIMPTLFNNLSWRSLYEYDGRYYSDRIWISWFALSDRIRIVEGQSVERFAPSDIMADENVIPDFARDQYRVFQWFSQDWLAEAPDRPGFIGDMRYSYITEGLKPLWGIEFNNPDRPIDFIQRTDLRQIDLQKIRWEIFGTDPAYKSLEELRVTYIDYE